MYDFFVTGLITVPMTLVGLFLLEWVVGKRLLG